MIPLPFQKEEIKDTTKTVSSASFLDTYCTFDTNSQLSTRWYDKRDDFNFAIINFLQLDSNISTALAYGVYNSQLLRYARPWSLYSDFFITSPSSDYQTIISSVLKNHLIISFFVFISRQHIVWKYSDTCMQATKDGIRHYNWIRSWLLFHY